MTTPLSLVCLPQTPDGEFDYSDFVFERVTMVNLDEHDEHCLYVRGIVDSEHDFTLGHYPRLRMTPIAATDVPDGALADRELYSDAEGYVYMDVRPRNGVHPRAVFRVRVMHRAVQLEKPADLLHTVQPGQVLYSRADDFLYYIHHIDDDGPRTFEFRHILPAHNVVPAQRMSRTQANIIAFMSDSFDFAYVCDASSPMNAYELK